MYQPSLHLDGPISTICLSGEGLVNKNIITLTECWAQPLRTCSADIYAKDL